MRIENIDIISEKYNIPVRQLNRLNVDKWYHGTTIDGYKSICEQGVRADYNYGTQLDFGMGFYLTDSIDSASKYMSRLPDFNENGEIIKRTNWCVVEFTINPYKVIFESGNAFKFCNFAQHDDEFAKFVFENRLNNVYNEKPHGYDIIWGVMSDSIPPEVILAYQNKEITYEDAIAKLKKSQSMKQLYIGKQEICDMLVVSDVFIFDEKEEN